MPINREQFARRSQPRMASGANRGRMLAKPAEVRFWERVDRSSGDNGCWLWQGAPNGGGYGVIVLGSGEKMLAHRYSFRLENGYAPIGMDVCHRCDVRLCVNPRHLFVGTRKDNMQDCAQKGRVFAPRGEASPNAKLTFAQVQQVRKIWNRGGLTKTEIGRRFGISSMHVFKIVAGRTRVCA